MIAEVIALCAFVGGGIAWASIAAARVSQREWERWQIGRVREERYRERLLEQQAEYERRTGMRARDVQMPMSRGSGAHVCLCGDTWLDCVSETVHIQIRCRQCSDVVAVRGPRAVPLPMPLPPIDGVG